MHFIAADVLGCDEENKRWPHRWGHRFVGARSSADVVPRKSSFMSEVQSYEQLKLK
jgi:hypothetical protein